MRTRSAPALAGLTALGLMATACGGGSEEDGAGQEGTLVIWTDPERSAAVQSAAEGFAEANGVRVEVQNLSFDDIQGDLVNAHQAGNAPDLFLGAHDWVGNLVRNGAVQPVELPAERAEGLDETAVEAMTLDGRLMGVPYAQENLFLMRNTELVPEAPETFEELVAAGSELRDRGEVEEVLSMAVGQEGDPYRMNPFMRSAGGYLFGQDEDGAWDPGDLGTDSDATVEAMQTLADYGEGGEGVLRRSIDVDNDAALFFEGQAPFFVAGPWNLADAGAADVETGISALPGFEDGEPASTYIGYHAFFVTEGGANSALAEEFVVNHTTDAAFVLDLYGADPRTPVQTEALETVSEDDPDVAAVAEAAEHGVAMPNIPEMGETWEPLGVAQAQIIGGQDPREALETAHEQITERIGQ